jgi:hypothetical protein
LRSLSRLITSGFSSEEGCGTFDEIRAGDVRVR